MEQLPPSDDAWSKPETISYAFKEYELLTSDTAMFLNNRQALSNTFLSVINFGFLTAAGYLVLQYVENSLRLVTLTLALFVIAIIITGVNILWFRLSEQNRRVLNLRLRYLAELEKHLAQSESFPSVTISLRSYETSARKASGNATFTGRGIYTTEGETLYEATAKNKAFGFTDAEVGVGQLFIVAHWLAFIIAAIMYWPSFEPYLLAWLTQVLGHVGIRL